MAESDKPKVPPTTQRSSGDTGVPQRGEVKDDPRQATESGEQDETNRSRGRVIDESGAPAGGTAGGSGKKRSGKGEHWESGRHQAG